MKAIQKILIIMLISLVSFNGYADGETSNNPDKIYTTMFYNEISTHLHYPDAAKMQGIEGFVVVSFTILSDGKIQILEMNSSDPMFNEAAVQSMSEITLCSHASGKIYNMQFNYSLL